MKSHKADVLNDVWSQFLILVLLMMLAVDSLNPIKAVSGFLGFPSFYWGFLFFLIMLGVIYHNISDVIYRCVRVFLHSILSISFKSIEIVGADNIPTDGPVIFTGNHANQFVDGLVVLMNTPRKVGFMIAEKSWHRPVIGYLSQVMGCIPVVRPQDSVIKGIGQVKMGEPTTSSTTGKKEYTLVGENTQFTSQLASGDQVRYQGKTVKDSGSPVKVERVIDDTHVILSGPLCNDQDQTVVDTWAAFGIFKKVDQSTTFQHVYDHLKRGDCIGIFPEGGSHDRTDLLPLKAGVAIMALGVKDKYNINAAVVPVGLNYFRGHRFRGRVVIEFGTPITATQELMKTYEQDKRKACNEFLHLVEEAMRSVIVTAPDYNILQLVYTARRLFQRSGVRPSATQTQDLNRRFAEGYKILSTNSKAKEDLDKLHDKLQDYNKNLKLMGLKDHQVPFIAWWTVHDVIGSALYGFLIFALASIPSFVLNAPVGLVARYVSLAEQKKALAGSKVKIAGRDVLLSKKIIVSIVGVPVVWIFYLFMVLLVTDWYWSSICLLFLSCPLFSFFGVRSVEAGMIELKTIRPLFYRLLPKYRQIQDELPRRRAELQWEVRNFVKKYATELGPLAEKKKMDWNAFMHERAAIDTQLKINQKEETKANKETTMEAEASDVNSPRTSESNSNNSGRITKEHDLSFLRKSNSKSSIDLTSLEQKEEEEEEEEKEKEEKENKKTQ